MPRPRGSLAELEQRRLRAIELLLKGLQPHEVAERLGVARQSVRRWKQAYLRKGQPQLAVHPVSDHGPKLVAAGAARASDGPSRSLKRSAI